jgi:hypothetical protein
LDLQRFCAGRLTPYATLSPKANGLTPPKSNATRAVPTGESIPHRRPLKFFTLLDHPFGLLVRVFNAQVFGARRYKSNVGQKLAHMQAF